MADECKNCTVRGEYQKCISTPCSRHESWIDQQRMERITQLEAALVEVRRIAEYPPVDTEIWKVAAKALEAK